MNINIITSEFSPLIKATGFADLLKDLVNSFVSNHQVNLILPGYKCLEFSTKPEHIFFEGSIPGFPNRFYIYKSKLGKNLDLYAIYENKEFALVTKEKEFFALFQSQLLEPWFFFNLGVTFLLKMLPIGDSQVEKAKPIVHCFGWQTGLVPALIKDDLSLSRKYKTVFTVDILQNQGVFDKRTVFDRLPFNARLHELCDSDEKINFTRIGINLADMVTTVSGKYAQELQEVPYGNGLEEDFRELNRRGKLAGIVNGLNTREIDPANTSCLKSIDAEYHNDSLDILKRKEKAKLHLQEVACLRRDADIPLIAMGHRFTTQKNFLLLERIIESLMRLDPAPQLFIRTWPEPDPGTEEFTLWWKLIRHSRKYRFNIAFFEPYDRILLEDAPELFIDRFLYYAAGDIFLMPSLWEPCGLCQMEAMRFGCIPIVSKVGGLAETVIDIDENPENGTGFVFGDPLDEKLFLEKIMTALNIRRNRPETWLRMLKNTMNSNFSIEQTARRYISEIYGE